VSGRLTSSSQHGTHRLPPNRPCRQSTPPHSLTHSLPPSLRPSVPTVDERTTRCAAKQVQFLSRSPIPASPAQSNPRTPRRPSRWPLLRGIRSVFCGLPKGDDPLPSPSPQQCHHSHRVTPVVLESRRPAIDPSLAESNSRPRAKSAALGRVPRPTSRRGDFGCQ
jgi:hypothetical protein